MSALAARPICAACRRPVRAWVPAAGSAAKVPTAGMCFCDRVTVIPTRTRILILQHPRERNVPIGTARMAHRSLAGSRLRVGLDFADHPEVREAVDGPDTYVLFPGAGALPADQVPRDRPITLVVLDGTWSQARKLLRLNPAIAGLPRVAFHPRRPSAYVIRREPAEFCVSTIEALAEVLRVLEPEGGGSERLLDPFHAMVERHRWFETAIGASRHLGRPRRVRVSPRAALARRLAADWSRLVCVHGEANAWPRHHPARQEPETVHWVAHRPATAETFETVMAPRQVLSPDTPDHIGLSPERLRAGGTVREWHDAWRNFTRPDDILVMWGTYYRGLAAADGLPLAFPSVDLRAETARILGERFGAIEDSMDALGAAPTPLALLGRGGSRLAALVGALETLRDP